MLTVNDVAKRFGDHLLFEHVTFTVNIGDRIALVGPNGAGKSTLLRIVTGEERPDSGSVRTSSATRVGYLRQGFADIPHGTLRDLLDVPLGGLFAAERDLEAASAGFADATVDPVHASDAYDAALGRFESRGGYELQSTVNALLDRFRLADVGLDRALDTLSGGQKTRAGLAALLASRPDVLLLDEPTNHLDAEALAWLGTFLQEYDGALLIVSHDRAFLDEIATSVLELDDVKRTVRMYPGNYSAYRATRSHEEDEAQAAWYRQQLEVERITKDIRAAEGKARSIENSTIDFAVRKKAAKIVRPAVVRKRKLERLLQSEDAAEKPEQRWGMALSLEATDSGARDAVVLEDVCVGYGDVPVLRNVDLLIRHGDRLAIAGANGSGKTTLLKVITGELAPTTGRVRLGPGVKVGYFSQEQQTLDPSITVLEQARRVAAMSESDTRTELHKFLFGGDSVHKRVGDLSYGERARLMLALLVFQQTTLLLLDEPLNHLDIQARESFERALMAFHGTLVMVLHDMYSVERLATRVVLVQEGTVTESFLAGGNDAGA